jgi:hypothetical protein
MGAADAAGHWDVPFVAAGVLELHVAGTGVHARCGRDDARRVGRDDEGVARLRLVRASRLARARTSA